MEQEQTDVSPAGKYGYELTANEWCSALEATIVRSCTLERRLSSLQRRGRRHGSSLDDAYIAITQQQQE
jgi:hypothetical protein